MEAGPSTVAQSLTEGSQVVDKNIYRYLILILVIITSLWLSDNPRRIGGTFLNKVEVG